jgi:hypothetical protein
LRLIINPYLKRGNNMDINKKAIIALALLLVIAYGLSMATAGVSTPGCTESGP